MINAILNNRMFLDNRIVIFGKYTCRLKCDGRRLRFQTQGIHCFHFIRIVLINKLVLKINAAGNCITLKW